MRVHVFKGEKVLKRADGPLLVLIYVVSLMVTFILDVNEYLNIV